MIASARVAYLTKRAADYGIHAGPAMVDMLKVRERKRNIVNDFRSIVSGVNMTTTQIKLKRSYR
jgi:pyruvate/2-oxoglutarate dehydrogenase complex dihydrolipoamide dehydrogenase (E3) component